MPLSSAAQHSTAHHSTAQHSTSHHSSSHHSTAKRSAAQQDVAQHSTDHGTALSITLSWYARSSIKSKLNKKKQGRGLSRIPETVEQFQSIDTVFYTTFGFGLVMWVATYRLLPGQPLTLQTLDPVARHFLKVVIDRKSSGFKTFNYCFQVLGLRGFCTRDISHGEWRDFIGGVNGCKKMVELTKFIVIQNISKGPWLGGDFKRRRISVQHSAA